MYLFFNAFSCAHSLLPFRLLSFWLKSNTQQLTTKQLNRWHVCINRIFDGKQNCPTIFGNVLISLQSVRSKRDKIAYNIGNASLPCEIGTTKFLFLPFTSALPLHLSLFWSQWQGPMRMIKFSNGTLLNWHWNSNERYRYLLFITHRRWDDIGACEELKKPFASDHIDWACNICYLVVLHTAFIAWMNFLVFTSSDEKRERER